MMEAMTMAYRKPAKKGSRAAPKRKAAPRRKAIKRAVRPKTVKLVIENQGPSAVARPDGIAGAFQIADRNAGRSKY